MNFDLFFRSKSYQENGFFYSKISIAFFLYSKNCAIYQTKTIFFEPTCIDHTENTADETFFRDIEQRLLRRTDYTSDICCQISRDNLPDKNNRLRERRNQPRLTVDDML